MLYLIVIEAEKHITTISTHGGITLKLGGSSSYRRE